MAHCLEPTHLWGWLRESLRRGEICKLSPAVCVSEADGGQRVLPAGSRGELLAGGRERKDRENLERLAGTEQNRPAEVKHAPA